jgi:hypothetical protein
MSKTTGVAAFCGPYGDGEGSGKATTAHPSIQQAFQQRLSFMPRGGPRANSGGRREGAGRKPGNVWAPKVSEWRACAAENAAAIVGSDRDPLIYLIDRVFDETRDTQTRVGCAAIATKYLHPMLSASQVSASHTVVKVGVCPEARWGGGHPQICRAHPRAWHGGHIAFA